jgi:hypothetical protein
MNTEGTQLAFMFAKMLTTTLHEAWSAISTTNGLNSMRFVSSSAYFIRWCRHSGHSNNFAHYNTCHDDSPEKTRFFRLCLAKRFVHNHCQIETWEGMNKSAWSKQVAQTVIVRIYKSLNFFVERWDQSLLIWTPSTFTAETKQRWSVRGACIRALACFTASIHHDTGKRCVSYKAGNRDTGKRGASGGRFLAAQNNHCSTVLPDMRAWTFISSLSSD